MDNSQSKIVDVQDDAYPYRTLNSYLKRRFGGRTHKISLHAGMSCPNLDGVLSKDGCLYCNNLSFNPNAAAEEPSITRQLLEGIALARSRYNAHKFIAYFQTFSNTYADPERLRRLYFEAMAVPDIVALAISTRPDCLSDEVLEVLVEVRSKIPVWIELGVQTANEATLKLIGRSHGVREIISAVERLSEASLETVAHIILGLPGESGIMMMDTAHFVAGLSLQGVKIHHLHAVSGTRLASWFHSGVWRPLDWLEYVQVVVDFIERIPEHFIIHRVIGDCPNSMLIAPRWPVGKARILSEITAEFSRRGSRQGSKVGIG